MSQIPFVDLKAQYRRLKPRIDAAIQDVLFGLTADVEERLPNPLFLHGPSGSGKTFLVQALIAELTTCGKDVCSISANDFAATDDLTDARDATRAV